MGAKKALMILGIVVAVLLVAAGVAAYALTRSTPLEPYHDPIDATARDRQTLVSLALTVAGVDGAFVVLQNGTLHVAYDLPVDDSTTPEDWQRVVLGAAAPLANGTTTLRATQFVEGNATLEWSVPTAKVQGYLDGTVTEEELEAAITKTTL